MISWFVKNPVAANLLMFGVFFTGIIAALRAIPVETFPSSERNTVTISTEFRGSTPRTAEDGITLRIEEAIADIEGIEEITSRSSEGRSTVIAEVSENYHKRDVLDDIKVRVDALNILPDNAEKPVISVNVRNPVVIFIAIQGNVSAHVLRQTANRFREDLVANPHISNVELQGIADYEINIEVSPQTLDNYNLTLAQIGNAIRLNASDVSAGSVRTLNGDILVRSDGQAYNAAEFARIPIIANREGAPVTLGQLANIKDGFEEKSLITTFNGKPAVMVEVRRVGGQSAIRVAEQTRAYMQTFSHNMPSGVSIDYWDDDSEYLKTRIDAVLINALLGGLLVMLLLSLFLSPAVAFWVCLGIPVSFMGAFLFMPHVDGSFNVISLFAFIMVIGIVVDDAIVTGENIYRKIREGMAPLAASINGTREITVPVTFGILTTVVAFAPLSFLEGTRFAFISAQIPMVVIPVLLMSLVESKLILPSHMRHVQVPNPHQHTSRLAKLRMRISRGLENFVRIGYRPFLEKCISNKVITLVTLIAVSSIIVAAVMYGHIQFRPFPRVESDKVRITLTMPESTGFETTHAHIQKITRHFQALQKKHTDPNTGESVIMNILATSGSSDRTQKPNIGSVRAELQPEDQRVINLTTHQLAREIRQRIGQIPGAQSLSVKAEIFNSNAPINIELSGARPERMYEVVLLLKEKFKAYPGIFDIQDNFSGGKEELKLNLKPRAYLLGLRLNDVAQQVRSAVFGFQAQRIQRGRDELRVMVRYPLANRSSIGDLNNLPIRVPNSNKNVLLSEIANLTPFESPGTLYRINRKSVLNITADVDKDIASVALILKDIDQYLQNIKLQYPDIKYRYDGEAEDTQQTNDKLALSLIMVLISVYALLAIPFKSYGQPFIVMSIIPFGLIGAVAGHAVTFQTISVMSVFGMLALVGVLVNDSLVLVDYINKRRQRGTALVEAVVTAASIRFRPVLLTSLTTFAGLIPMLLDNSQQAKFLKPMATSLGFGILFATVITLIIVPVNYLVARQFKHYCIDTASRLWNTWLDFWNKEPPRQRPPGSL